MDAEEQRLQQQEYNKNYRKRMRQEIKAWLAKNYPSPKCSICGEDRAHVLQQHHIDPSTKKFEISRAVRRGDWSLQSFIEEINKCRLLCASCHVDHHWRESQCYSYYTRHLSQPLFYGRDREQDALAYCHKFHSCLIDMFHTGLV